MALSSGGRGEKNGAMAAAGRRRRCRAGGHTETSGAIERRPCGEGQRRGSLGVKDGPVKLAKAAAQRLAGPSSGGRAEKDGAVEPAAAQ